MSQNRTYWPISGGAVAFQPGWFAGHGTALMYVNLGLGENPQNYSMPMVPVFEIIGLSDNPYPGTVCLPQVPLPAGVTPKNGDLASIQIVEAAKHGAGMFSVRRPFLPVHAISGCPATALILTTAAFAVRRHHLHRRHV